MTAEVAVMNKLAVALAADSAVTVTAQRGAKIFNSANKLFALSRHAPVGTMIYGAAQFMGVPWETIIKVYRSKLGRKKFDTLKEYADDFLEFIRDSNPMFAAKSQDDHFRSAVTFYLNYLRTKIDGQIQIIIENENGIDEPRIESVVVRTVHSEYETWQASPTLDSMPPNCSNTIIERYEGEIRSIRDQVLQNLPIGDSAYVELEAICGFLFTKDFFAPNMVSGLVISGFGETEVYPRLLEYSLEAVICGELKHKEVQSITIGVENAAAITPFAQSEMVHSFMGGIDPSLYDFVKGYLAEVFKQTPAFVADALKLSGESERSVVTAGVSAAVASVMDDFRKQMENRRRSSYINPVLNAVEVLPKDELAEMAESLVNLTSFKRRVSMQDETVGGPVDVVVISKGDGLIWIRRKHYFDSSLNPQYMAKFQPEAHYDEP